VHEVKGRFEKLPNRRCRILIESFQTGVFWLSESFQVELKRLVVNECDEGAENLSVRTRPDYRRRRLLLWSCSSQCLIAASTDLFRSTASEGVDEVEHREGWFEKATDGSIERRTCRRKERRPFEYRLIQLRDERIPPAAASED
jgi:hypothetical protein